MQVHILIIAFGLSFGLGFSVGTFINSRKIDKVIKEAREQIEIGKHALSRRADLDEFEKKIS